MVASTVPMMADLMVASKAQSMVAMRAARKADSRALGMVVKMVDMSDALQGPK